MTSRGSWIAGAFVLVAHSAAMAQTPDAGATASIEPQHFEVNGLSPGDQLNLRANASATGMMIGRLHEGSVVLNLGCADIKKVRWCKIADVANPAKQGWAAARYLVETQYEELEPLDAPAQDPDDTGSYPDIDNSGASILPN